MHLYSAVMMSVMRPCNVLNVNICKIKMFVHVLCVLLLDVH